MYLLQAAPGGGGFQFIFLGLMIVVFWLFFIRPQAKKAKSQKSIAGIHGVVNKLNDDGTINLEVNPGSYIKIEKSAISMEWTTNLNKPVAVDKK
jgi:preprotein translocase subunit YajC